MPSGTMRSGCGWYHSSYSQSFHARMHAEPELAVGRVEEHAAAEPGDLRREVHRRPDAVDVHVAHAGVDVVAAGAHLVEAERLELHRFRAPAGDRVHADLGVALALELPDLVALARLDDPRRPLLELRRAAAPRRCAAARRRGRRPRSPCTSPRGVPARAGTARRPRSSAATELPAQPLLLVTHALLRDRSVGREVVEPVAGAGIDVQLRRHARLVQPEGVVDVLVTKPVDGADRQERGRQTREVSRPAPAPRCPARRRGRRARPGTTSTRRYWIAVSRPGGRPAGSTAVICRSSSIGESRSWNATGSSPRSRASRASAGRQPAAGAHAHDADAVRGRRRARPRARPPIAAPGSSRRAARVRRLGGQPVLDRHADHPSFGHSSSKSGSSMA